MGPRLLQQSLDNAATVRITAQLGDLRRKKRRLPIGRRKFLRRILIGQEKLNDPSPPFPTVAGSRGIRTDHSSARGSAQEKTGLFSLVGVNFEKDSHWSGES